jgi:hypothetical protein
MPTVAAKKTVTLDTSKSEEALRAKKETERKEEIDQWIRETKYERERARSKGSHSLTSSTSAPGLNDKSNDTNDRLGPRMSSFMQTLTLPEEPKKPQPQVKAKPAKMMPMMAGFGKFNFSGGKLFPNYLGKKK